MQGTQFKYAIKFVADMDKAVKFYRDVVGLTLKFESPGWSEFVTGETTLALHPASDKNPAGKVELGFTVADVEAFYRDMSAKGVLFSMPPKKQDFGGVLAQLTDEIVLHHGTTMVRRLRLATGGAMPWHRDPFRRVAVAISRDVLSIEYRDGGDSQRVEVTPGHVRAGAAGVPCVHRAVEYREAAR
jgi:uncharacterized glyoxalase superfamily protein PhnB